MVQEPDFIWLKKELVSGNTSLLLYQVPINAIKNKDNLVSNIIKMRDSVGALYIHGKEPNTDMITEEAYSPYFFKIKLDGKLTYEMKGTWELRNDFMSGPFINYAILTKKTIGVVLEGFCYSPSKEKRDLMHQLESIIKSVSVLKVIVN
jgi:isopenicillin N synthase-like dioxygenase